LAAKASYVGRQKLMALPDNAIVEFWDLFRLRAAALAAIESADDPTYDELLEKLHRIDPGLYFELSSNPGACELIVTAEGERDLFPLARTVVGAAPMVDGWTIQALKPKLGFPVTTQWENLTLVIADIAFDPVECDGGKLGLRIFVPGLDPKDAEDAHNALLRAMDHGLGEEMFAEAIQGTEVHPMPAGATASNFIPLVELEAFVRWRERKRSG
jgi:hypothetical protein